VERPIIIPKALEILETYFPEVSRVKVSLASELAGNDPMVNSFAQAYGAAYLANQELRRMHSRAIEQPLQSADGKNRVISEVG
jgi:hypothetical protein